MRIEASGNNAAVDNMTKVKSSQGTQSSQSTQNIQGSQNTQGNQNISEKVNYDGRQISQISSAERRDMPVSEKMIIEAIEKANKALMGANQRFEFKIHDKTKEIMVKVIDTDTNEVIREIPNEKILDMVAKLCEMAGILVDERR